MVVMVESRDVGQGSVVLGEETAWRRCTGRKLTLRRSTENSNSTSTGDCSTDTFNSNRCLIARSSMRTVDWDGYDSNSTVGVHNVLLLLTTLEQFSDSR